MKENKFTEDELRSCKLAYEYMFDAYKKIYRSRVCDQKALEVGWIIKHLKNMQSALLKMTNGGQQKIEFAPLKEYCPQIKH